jgi:GH25 family lysozyme M1 (1,4-beta-N-acetylmuramidase)
MTGRRSLRRRLVALSLPLLLALLPAVPPAAATGRIQGVDTAKYQHDNGRAIDWAAVSRSGQRFAFIKATGHANRTDPWFSRDWAAAGRAGVIRGAYHFADPSSSAITQADAVVRVVGSTREARDLGIVLDLESSGGLSPSRLVAWTHAFLDRVQSRTGRTPILYTYVSFWSNAMGSNRGFGAYPLWLARYGALPAPLAGWDRWTFWQHTSQARVPGIAGSVDHDLMCCSTGTLAALSDGRSGPIKALWHLLGGASGTLGLPLGPEVRIPDGWGQSYEHGYVASTRTHGTSAVLSPILARYLALGGPFGRLGVPLGPVQVPFVGLRLQQFTGGTIVWSKLTGAHEISGAVLSRWVHDGGVRSQEGLPTTGRVGVAQQFLGGGLYVTPTGVHLVPGLIRDRYEELGGVNSLLGLPSSEVKIVLGGRLVSFTLGSLLEITVAGTPMVI